MQDMEFYFYDLIVCGLCYDLRMDRSPTVYIPIRLPHRAVAKLDLLGWQWLCRSRSETMRRLIADHPCLAAGRVEDAGPSEDSEAAA
jgi:hypothetical protein